MPGSDDRDATPGKIRLRDFVARARLAAQARFAAQACVKADPPTAYRQFDLVAVFVFGLALGVALAAFGGSLRTLPHGSLETFASGIFLSES